ncbi:hypothetical protein [Xanthomonas arboricola]|uniref:hypothetical protein n=1 Tax=Xanthomonas arboricola TaxID=56448 RepID=UPI000F8D78EE|nr:hypothetical protein [Xanthomonas arboricola]
MRIITSTIGQKMITKIALFTVLVLVAGNSKAWTLVYETDANGNVVSGSLRSLRTAVDAGASVKVLVPAPNIHVWTVQCTHTSLRLDASQAVVCMGETDLVVDVTVGSQFAVVSSPLQSHHYLLNTLGQYALAAVNIKTGDLISNTSTIRPMRWYVE